MSEDIIITRPEPDAEQVIAISTMETWSADVKVIDNATRTEAMEAGKRAKAYRKSVTEWFAASKAASHKAWKAIVAQEKSLTDVLDRVERAIKKEVVRYDDEQEALRRKELARLQAIADEDARKERERLEKQAAKLKTPELKEARLEEAAMVQAPVVNIAPAVEKTKGESTRKVWKVELTDMKALVNAAAGGNGVALSLLLFNESAARKFSSATKGAIEIPGVTFRAESSMAWKV